MALPARTNIALLAPGTLLLGMFFIVPAIAVAIDAFREGRSAFGRVFATAGFWDALAGSAVLTLVASIASTVIGFLVALHLSRLSERARTALSFVIALPLTFSGLIVAYGFILGYGRAGFITQLLAYAGLDAATIGGALFTPVGLAFASSYYLIPRVVIGMLPVMVRPLKSAKPFDIYLLIRSVIAVISLDYRRCNSKQKEQGLLAGAGLSTGSLWRPKIDDRTTSPHHN